MNVQVDRSVVSWLRAAAKRKVVCRTPTELELNPEVTELVCHGAAPWHGRWGLPPPAGSYVIPRGVQPVREINGAVLSDQRVRWKPEPPSYDVADVAAARARRQQAETAAQVRRREDERFREAMMATDTPPRPPPSFRNGGRADPGPRRDAADAFAWAFSQRASRPGTPESSMKNTLRMAIAAQPKGTAERARLEQLLRKIEEGG